MSKKYKIRPNGRIEALRDFGGVKAGEVGGFVESEKNLSHIGDAWVSGSARVYGGAQVSDNAWVFGDAWVYDSARVSGDAQVYGSALVYGDAWVYGDARVFGNALVYGDARVSDAARVSKPGECISISGLNHSITITPSLISVGCKRWTSLDDFEKDYKTTAKEEGYDEAEAEVVADIIRAVMRTFPPPKRRLRGVIE